MYLCCDQPGQFCQCSLDDFIFHSSVSQYLMEERLEFTDIYKRTNASSCVTCEHYMGDGCVPLRNLIRLHRKTGKFSALKLVDCSYFSPDPTQKPIMFNSNSLNNNSLHELMLESD